MRSLFQSNPYGRYDMGRFAAPAFARPVKMGCALHDILDKVDIQIQVEQDRTEEDHIEELDPNTLACKKCAKKHRRTNGRMGSSRMGDDLLDSAKSVFDSLAGTFGDLVKDVPPEAAGVYKDRLKTCQNMIGASPNAGSYVAATQCLRDLYKDIENKTGVTPASTPMPYVPPPSSFPIVPVAIAGVGALVLLYFMMKK